MKVEYLEDKITVSYEYTIRNPRDQPLRLLIARVANLLHDNKRADLKNTKVCFRLGKDIIKELGFRMKEEIESGDRKKS